MGFHQLCVKYACGGQILELIWIQNWLIHYEHRVQQSDLLVPEASTYSILDA